ncbi:phage portal protein [Clostridium tetani]|nr:phage portal protein [Clostridium tetani]
MLWLFREKEKREVAEETPTTLEDLLLQAVLKEDKITRQMALNIPTLSACIELISNTVAMLPIKLYKKENGQVTEVLDNRSKLLNDDTKDTLDGFQFKKVLIEDYLLMGNGYAYINKARGQVVSLHYVKEENVSISMGVDPIFKDYTILVNGDSYKPYDFIKILRKSRDGATGDGIIEENNKILAVAYNALDYENVLAKTGGNKKGFIKAASKLAQESIDELKEQWNKMYSKNSENCVVLNKGLEFQESSATPTEMQINENKITNGDEICKIFNVPPSIITGDGKANESDYDKFVKLAILPILKIIITALNRDLLLEKEKESFYFAFDTKDLLKGDMLKRYQAYEIAIKNKIMQINEVRYAEDKPPIEALEDTLVLGLQDVLYNTKNGSIYTPNTNKVSDMKGSEHINNEDRDT